MWVLNETVLLSTINTCLNWWVRKFSQFYAQKVCLSRPKKSFLNLSNRARSYENDTSLFFAYWVIYVVFLFIKTNFQKIISGTLSECQTDWIQVRTDILSVLIWDQTVCKGYQQTRVAAGRQRVKFAYIFVPSSGTRCQGLGLDLYTDTWGQ